MTLWYYTLGGGTEIHLTLLPDNFGAATPREAIGAQVGTTAEQVQCCTRITNPTQLRQIVAAMKTDAANAVRREAGQALLLLGRLAQEQEVYRDFD